MLRQLLTKFNFFLRRANNIQTEMQSHIDDAEWFEKNKENIKLELKSLKTDLTWLLDLMERNS